MTDYNPRDKGYQDEHDTGDYDDHDDYSPGNKYKVVYLKDPLIFRQCIHLRDVAVLLSRISYVEQYD